MQRILFLLRFLSLAGLMAMFNLPAAVQAAPLHPFQTSIQIAEEPLPPPEIQRAGRLEQVAQVGGAVMDVAVQNQTAYISKGTRLVILDLANPEGMALLGASEELPDIVQGVAAAGEYVYLAAGGAGLRIFNVLKPETPILLGSYNTWANSISLYERNDKRYACLTDGDLRLMDVSDPENPLEVASIPTDGYASNAILMDDLAYVADGSNGLLIVDISQTAQPKVLSSLALPGYTYGVVVSQDALSGKKYAYLANGSEGGIRVVDVSDALIPAELPPLGTDIDARDLNLTGGRLLAAGGENGLFIFDLSRPEAPVLQGTFDTSGYALGLTATGCSAYVADGAGLVAVDFSDVVNPKSTASYNVLGAAYRIALASQTVEGGQRTYAYVADYYSGMYILDVTSKSQRPTVTSFYDAPGYTNGLSLIQPYTQPAAPEVSEEHPSGAFGRWILLAGAQNGVRLVDATSPYFPQEIGVFDQSGVFDDPALTTEIQFSGVQANQSDTPAHPTAYLAEGIGGGLRILDITNLQHPKPAGYFKAGEGVYDAAVRQIPIRAEDIGGLRSTAAEAPDGVRTIAYLAAGTDGLRVVDVSDPENPSEITCLDTPVSARALALAGDILYLADGEKGGLRVLDVKNPTRPLETGHFASEGDAVGLTISGTEIILADGSAGVRIIDVSDPAHPVETAAFTPAGFTNSVAVQDDMIYAANRAAGLAVLRYLPANPKTFSVTSTADQPDATVGDGNCANLRGDCTLRAAIQEANANPGLDSIVLPTGAYILTLAGVEEDASQRGDLDIGDSLYLRGAGTEKTVIDGAGLERVLHVSGGRRPWIDIAGVTIQNGAGGGINVQNASLFSLRESIVTRNSGYGLWGSRSNIIIDHSVISENVEPRYVGGVGSSLGTLRIVDSSIIRNSGSDGGIYTDGSFTMIDTTVSGNSGFSGAGGLRLSGQAKVVNATISDNQGNLGGGLAVESGGKLTLTHTIVAGNRAQKSPDCNGSILSLGYNLIENPTGFVMERGGGDQIGVEAGLAALAEIDALSYGHHLLLDSPALDGGNPAGCPGSPGSEVTLDEQDYRLAIDGDFDGNPACDIGAMESNPTLQSTP